MGVHLYQKDPKSVNKRLSYGYFPAETERLRDSIENVTKGDPFEIKQLYLCQFGVCVQAQFDVKVVINYTTSIWCQLTEGPFQGVTQGVMWLWKCGKPPLCFLRPCLIFLQLLLSAG